MFLALHHVTCLNTEMKVIFKVFLVLTLISLKMNGGACCMQIIDGGGLCSFVL